MTINAHHFKILTNHLTFVSDGSIFVLICWAWLPRIFPVDLRGSLCNFCSDIFSLSVLNKNNSSSLESWSFFNEGRDRFKRSSTESMTRSQRLSFSQSAQLCKAEYLKVFNNHATLLFIWFLSVACNLTELWNQK